MKKRGKNKTVTDEKRKAYRHDYYLAHKEKAQEYQRQYNLEHPKKPRCRAERKGIKHWGTIPKFEREIRVMAVNSSTVLHAPVEKALIMFDRILKGDLAIVI